MLDDQDQSKPSTPETGHPEIKPAGAKAWAWPTAWMVTVLLCVGGGVFALKSCYEIPLRTAKTSGQVLEKLGDTLGSVAAGFRKGTIHTSFTSFATTLSTTHYLQFATLKQMEVFRRSDARAFAYIPLPEVVVEARAPIEYTYYLDLNAKWEFVLRENVMHVYPPPIEFNQPSVDVARLDVEVKKGGVGSDQVRNDLIRSISFLAREKARSNVPLVKETGRKAVTDFVEQWLVKAFSDGQQHPVKVHFVDELEAAPLKVQIEPPPQ